MQEATLNNPMSANPAIARFIVSSVKYSFLVASMLLCADSLRAEDSIEPSEIVFRRQAVRRMVFDRDQAIPLADFSPSKIVALDLMHPESVSAEQRATSTIDSDVLTISANGSPAHSNRWVGGFNPFATYEIEIESLAGDGTVGIEFSDPTSSDRLTADLTFRDGKPSDVQWQTIVAGNKVETKTWPVGQPLPKDEPFVLRVQMAAVGANLFIESQGRSSLLGYIDFSKHLELRKKVRVARFQFAITSSLEPSASIRILNASAAITPGTGQADIRAITDELGQPLLDDGRIWFTVTMRGRALPHPMQGVMSLNPSVFDVRFEGLIVFDAGDGLLRNELASHLFRETTTGQWRGWTTGFSSLGNKKRGDAKAILAVWSDRDPRRGYSIMKSRPIGIEGAHEDPHCVFDEEAQKWRLLLCEHAGKYRAAMWESDEWDNGYSRIAGPVDVDSTGTLIQSFGTKRYALFGSADRRIYIRNYPDLTPAGELQVELPPWNEDHGTRVWPNVIPLPDGYPAPYIALMMDRANFPGMPKRNWTYGALYLFHGHVQNEQN